jgi:hypothetical protein
VRQKGILLRAIPAMNLIDEDHRPPPRRFKFALRIGDRLAQIGHA